MREKRRILFVANSQGTAAGFDGDLFWSSYPLLVQERMPHLDCRYWMASNLDVSTIDTMFREIIRQHRPDLVILQCGIIECALRILPRGLRDLLRILPGGRHVTKVLHDRQRAWRSLLNRFGIRFLDVEPEAFRTHLRGIREKCAECGFRLAVLRIPLLSEQCERDVLPGTNEMIAKYNGLIDRLAEEGGIFFLDPFEKNTDDTRNSLFLKDSVHFSEKGHRLITENLVRFLSSGPAGDVPP